MSIASTVARDRFCRWLPAVVTLEECDQSTRRQSHTLRGAVCGESRAVTTVIVSWDDWKTT
jgi:hypothetical protein